MFLNIRYILQQPQRERQNKKKLFLKIKIEKINLTFLSFSACCVNVHAHLFLNKELKKKQI